jgi:DNA-binding NarL/FixJ family response regulator
VARPRVLLADDHPAIVAALGRLLSEECDVVGAVAAGTDVADAAARLQPVVTVVDLNLPGVSGLDVCRQIRRTDPRAQVIVMSAMIDDATTEAVLAAGASAFFQKFAPTGELIAAVKRAWIAST